MPTKKTQTGAGQKLKEAKAAAKKQAEDIKEAVAAHKIEDKKNIRKAGRTVKETAKKTAQAVKNKAEDLGENVTARQIERKKAVRKASRTVKETAKNTSQAVKNKAEDLGENVTAHAIEDKKAVRQAARNAKAKVEGAKEKASYNANKSKAKKLSIVFESPLGGTITPEQVAARVPRNATNVYVRIDQNKLYYVLKNGETGSVDIWE